MNRYAQGALAAWMVVMAAGSGNAQEGFPLEDKTLVVWAAPSDLKQQGGAALTVNDTLIDRFDAVVYGELRQGVWMPGSNNWARTCKDQHTWPRETAKPDQFVQIAIVYQGQDVAVYRDGEPYARYTAGAECWAFRASTAVLMGPRHLSEGVEHFQGRIRDARIYAVALEADVIAAMKPGEPVPGVEAWAWWDFAGTGLYDKARRFNQVRLSGGAHIAGGCLVLKGERSALVAAPAADGADVIEAPDVWSKDGPVPPAAVQSARVLREKLLEDPYRPGYHFCVPEDNGRPGDANGCFYAAGRYHLMYLYNRTGVGFCWGHVSSNDLVHWRHHPDAIGPGGGDEGCFSGGGFLDDDGQAYLSYWMLWGAKGIGLAKSAGPHYDHWEKLEANPVIESTDWGITETRGADGEPLVYGSADPTNVWKHGDKYYIATGNLLVLNKYGRKRNAPEDMQGDRIYLFESNNLADWAYKGVFYDRNPEWTDANEDNMCPSFLPLPARPEGGPPSGKHLLLFISHNKGCQYYVGDYDAAHGRFIPDNHGRMTWIDNTYFAPEALVDGDGRQIMWAWLTDNPAGEETQGWSGVFGLPRSLWLGEDGTLRMRPVEELDMLRCRGQAWRGIALDGDAKALDGVKGDSCELEIVVAPGSSAQRVGVKVRASADGEEETLLYYDAGKRALCFDARRSGVDGRRVLEEGPFALEEGEPLVLRVFVDKSVVEVYANDRQAVCRRVYPGRSDSLGVVLFAQDGVARFTSVKAWEMMPSNPY